MGNWYLGTMGFSYKDWSGPFYPIHLYALDYLGYYSEFFNAVEIDSTFYGTPRKEIVQRWAAVTPVNFKICVKLPKLITHELKLIGTEKVLKEFLDTISLLGDKLGVILIQFPPSFTISKFTDLAQFLDLLPHNLHYAVEVRHRSWQVERMEKLLSEHEIAWASTEYEQLPKLVHHTADYLYFRLIGQNGRFRTHERERIDVTQQLAWWWEHLQPFSGDSNSIYGFFNNDYAGFAVGTCSRFKSLVGLEAKPFFPPRQGTLFDI